MTRILAIGLEMSVAIVIGPLPSLHCSGPDNGSSWLNVNLAQVYPA